MTRKAFYFLALLAGCASSQGAPISYGGAGAPQAQAPPPAVRAPDDASPLAAYALRPEDAQPFDPARLPATHRVSGHESLYDIATRYQVPLRALIDQNNLEPPYALSPGRALELPPPRFHVVARGETLRDVAAAYNVDYRSLALLNRLPAPYAVRAGDRVVLPALARARAALDELPALTPPPAAGPARFRWPVRGEIVARFGAQAGGGRLDGVEIATRAGEPILAAEAGDVVYAGSDLPAYGALVLVRHADGFVTAYGRARRTLVREGQGVRAGEPLAEAGERLLFQVRRGREALDPLPLLGAPGR